MTQSLTPTATIVIVLGLAAILVSVLVLRQGRSKQDYSVWFLSSLVGILIGVGGSAAVMQVSGYELARPLSHFTEPDAEPEPQQAAGSEDSGRGRGRGR